MVLFWPHTHQNIFLQPFKLALESFLFGFGTPAVLFNGEIFHPNELPKSYILVNLFYKMPEFVILSFVIFLILFFKISLHFKNKFKGYNFKILTILLIIIFPNHLILASPYSAYDGLRLFLFLIPLVSNFPFLLIKSCSTSIESPTCQSRIS